MGIECRRCRFARRCVPGDLSAAEGQELAQLPRAPLKASFVAGDGLQIPSESARGPILQPLCAHERLALRAVPVAAAVERNALMTAGIPLLDVATQRRRAAAPGGSHDTALPMAERVSVIVTIRKPDLAEDVRHLEPLGAHFDPQK